MVDLIVSITKITRHLSVIKLSRVKLVIEPIVLFFFVRYFKDLFLSSLGARNIAQDEFFLDREGEILSETTMYKRKIINEFYEFFPLQFLTFWSILF